MCILVHLNKIREDQIQRGCATKYVKNSPHVFQFVYGTRNLCMYTGSVSDVVKTGRLRLSAESIKRIKQTFSCSLINSIRTAAREYEFPSTTVYKIAHNTVLLQNAYDFYTSSLVLFPG